MKRNPVPVTPIVSDPGLPQLDQALSSESMTAILKATGVFADARSCSPIYLRYKRGTNCLTLYEAARADGSVSLVYSKVYATPRAPRPSDRYLLSSYLPDIRMAISAFPRDQQIPELQKLWNSGPESHLFRRLISSRRRSRFEETWGNWSLVKYKPERRCLLRGSYRDPDWEDGLRGFFARVYSDSQGTRTARWHRHLARMRSLRLKIPNCLTGMLNSRILLVKEISGLRLGQYLENGGPDLMEHIRRAAEGLAELHRASTPTDLQPVRMRGQLSAALKSIEELGEPYRAAITDLADELHRSAPSPGAERLLHGDFYYDQILVDPSHRIGIIDLDELALGDPVVDVANFCAHLSHLALCGRCDHQLAGRFESHFVECYQRVSGQTFPQSSLRWHLAVSLLKLAPWPFRYFRPDWPVAVRKLLELAIARWEGRPC